MIEIARGDFVMITPLIFKLYAFNAPDDILKQRVLKRNQNLDGATFVIDEPGFDKMCAQFEPLDDYEARIDVPAF